MVLLVKGLVHHCSKILFLFAKCRFIESNLNIASITFFQCYVLMLFKIKRADIDGLNFTMQGPFVIYAEF